MIEKGRLCVSISLFLLTTALILHLVAMGYPRWKIYEHRTTRTKTIFIGIFHRCENRLLNTTFNYSETYFVCDDNKYCFYGNSKCKDLENINNEYSKPKMQYFCNLDDNPYACCYSPITKGLISCTIISACALGISLLLIYSHILINQFKYKIHMYVTIITIFLLFLGFIFLLITLILLGATMADDLHQYRYNLDYRAISNNTDGFKTNITEQAKKDYDIRLDWAGVFEIIALILSSVTIVSQIVYLIYIHRNRLG